MTYDDFMTSCRLDLGKATLTDMDKDRLTQWLNEAVVDAWGKPEWLIWPAIMDVQTVTLADYVTAWSGLNNSEAWTVWSADPREAFAEGKSVGTLRLKAVVDGTDLRVQAAAADAEVVFFGRQAIPVFTVAGPNADEVPDIFVPWIKAMMRVKMLDYGMAAQSEGTLTKAMAREEAEYQKVLYHSNNTLINAPWLSTLYDQ